MKIEEYLKESEKNKSHSFNVDEKIINLLQGTIGLSTEAGEILDNVKKHVFQGRGIDEVNIKEELGDIMWYMAIILRELDLDFEEILDANIRKLRSRYGEKFDKNKSLEHNRDRNIERKKVQVKE